MAATCDSVLNVELRGAYSPHTTPHPATYGPNALPALALQPDSGHHPQAVNAPHQGSQRHRHHGKPIHPGGARDSEVGVDGAGCDGQQCERRLRR